MLLAVTEKGSLSAAGRALDVPLPTLSRKISELEALLGARLLIRTTRKLTLTNAGIAYVAAARRILEQVEDAEREAAGEFTTPKGELVVTAPILFGQLHVLPVVADFLARYPDIDVRLLLADRNIDLVDDHVDMAVRIGALPDSSLVATRIGSMRTVTCASPALLAAHGIPQSPQDLARLPCIVMASPMPSADWRFQASGAPGAHEVQHIAIRPRLSVTTADGAARAAIRGVGVARLLHYQVAEALAGGTLRTILDDYEPVPAPVSLLHVSRGFMPLKMRSFLDFAAPRLRAMLEGGAKP